MQDYYSVNRRHSFHHDGDADNENNVAAGTFLLHSEKIDAAHAEPDVNGSLNGNLLKSLNESVVVIDKPELTCISEEKIADIDLLDTTSADKGRNGLNGNMGNAMT